MSTAAPVTPLLAGTLWAELAGELGVGLLLRDEHGRLQAVSEGGRGGGWGAAQLLGLTDDELASGKPPAGWRLVDDHDSALPGLSVLAGQVARADLAATVPVVISFGDLCRRLWVEMYPVVLRGARLVLIVLRPVYTDVWRGKGLLDPVTGLPNRILLFDRLDQALRRARVRGSRVSMVIADVRGLGAVNRAGGFERGDRILTEVADRLVGGLGADHTVARYAGGTFAVVADHPAGTGERLADRVARLADLRVGWVTSDGTDTVPDLVHRAQDRLHGR